jgi:hypothetical protein
VSGTGLLITLPDHMLGRRALARGLRRLSLQMLTTQALAEILAPRPAAALVTESST